jgi:predicted Zn-dependent protease
MQARGRSTRQTLKDGIKACRRGDWRAGLELLKQLAAEQEGTEEALPSLYYSYLGVAIARCEGRRNDGIELCRYAVKLGPREPDNRANLAQVYLIARNRRLAVRQLEAGLELAPRNRRLRQLGRQMGTRRRPAIPFLSRDNPLNYWIGRMTYQGPPGEDRPVSTDLADEDSASA